MESIKNLKNRAKEILGSVSFNIFIGENQILEILQEIIDNDIQEETIWLFSKTLNNIESYLLVKNKMIIQNDDYEYLKNIAEILRNQKVRIDEIVPFSSPVFKVHIDADNKQKNFAFITREGAKKYIEINSTALSHLHQSDKNFMNNENLDRRKKDLFDVENNTNLEIEKILEIIKRNY